MSGVSLFGKITEDPAERNSHGMKAKLAALAPQEICGLVFEETLDTATFFPKGKNGVGEPELIFDETPPSLKNKEVTGVSALATVTGMLESGLWRRVAVEDLGEARAEKQRRKITRTQAENNPEFITFREAWEKLMNSVSVKRLFGCSVISFVKQWNSRCAPEDRIEAYPPEYKKPGLVHKTQLVKAISRALEAEK